MLIKKDRKPMLPLVAKALETVFKDNKMIFMTAKASDIIFNGLDIQCERLVKLTTQIVKSSIFKK